MPERVILCDAAPKLFLRRSFHSREQPLVDKRVGERRHGRSLLVVRSAAVPTLDVKVYAHHHVEIHTMPRALPPQPS